MKYSKALDVSEAIDDLIKSHKVGEWQYTMAHDTESPDYDPKYWVRELARVLTEQTQ